MSQWFGAREGIATGCVTLGAPLGGIFFSLALQALFERLAWRTAALVLAGLMAGFLLLGNLLVEANVPSPAQTAGDDTSGSETAKVPGMLRSRQFWLISYAVFGERSAVHQAASGVRLVSCLCCCLTTAPGTQRTSLSSLSNGALSRRMPSRPTLGTCSST